MNEKNTEKTNETTMTANRKGGSRAASAFCWLLTGACFMLAGWFVCKMTGGKTGKGQPEAMMMQMPPSTVTAYTAAEGDFNPAIEYVGHVEAAMDVNVTPQIEGYIAKVNFQEGASVKAGDLLYEIDAERYNAVVNQRRADLAAAEAEADRAGRYLKRMQNVDARGITQSELDNAISAEATTKAAVLQAKANLALAEYDTSHTKIFAPIDGQIGKSAAYRGDFVSPSKGVMARIVQSDPVRVSFPMTDSAYVSWKQEAKGSLDNGMRMRLLLPNGTEYDKEGAWSFNDNEMSASTATLQIRLAFPNPDNVLVPNTFVRVVADLKTPARHVMIPLSAIIDTAGGIGVWVVKDAGSVEQRAIKVLPVTFNGMSAVVDGLKAGERIVLDGTQKLNPASKVAVVEKKTPDAKEEKAEAAAPEAAADVEAKK